MASKRLKLSSDSDLPNSLTSIVQLPLDLKEYIVNHYCLVRGDDGRKNDLVWIAKILDELPNEQVEVQWAYFPTQMPLYLQQRESFHHREILMTTEETERDIIGKDTLIAIVEVEEGCKHVEGCETLAWNRFYTKEDGTVSGPFVSITAETILEI
jgi:hypothetical protein